MDRERIVAVLTKAGLPVPAGDLLDAEYNMGRADWYVRTDAGWFWWSGKEWKECPYGPMR